MCFYAEIMVLSGHMPDLDSLEVFVAIAQTGSLGGAARELGLTQQAVSRRLAALEAKTGVTLAIRTTRGSQITPAGTSLAEWASHLLEVAHDIDTALGSLRNEGTQRLTVVASPTIVEYLMPHWLLSLRSAASRRNETVPRIDLAAANSAQSEAAPEVEQTPVFTRRAAPPPGSEAPAAGQRPAGSGYAGSSSRPAGSVARACGSRR